MSEGVLTREAIVAEGVRIADEGGLEKVSMRKIADALGSGVMSLYRHVPDKDSLLREMAAQAGEDYLYPAQRLGDPDWRARAHIAAHVDLDLYTHHPWVLLAHSVPRAAISPATVGCFDWLVEAFGHLTGDVADAAELTLVLWGHVQGVCLDAVGRALLSPGTSTDEAGFVATLAGHPLIDGHPRLQELTREQHPDLGSTTALLRSGVDALCDGFAARFPG